MAEAMAIGRPVHRLLALGAAAIVLLLAGLVARVPPGPGAGAPVPAQWLVGQVVRVDAAGVAQTVTLPDEVVGAIRAPVRVRYRWRLDLGARPERLALYASGLFGRARLSLNGRIVVDDIGDAPAELPLPARGMAAAPLIALPPALLRPGLNEFTLDLGAREWVGLSPIRIGDAAALHRLQAVKAAALVTGPMVVAAMIGSLGLGMLALWSRRPGERQYGSFGLGAVLWALHTLWSSAAGPWLPAPHATVWWTTLYAGVVVMLVLFALQFTQRSWPGAVRAALAALASTPLLLYLAVAAGVLPASTDVLRLLLVALAFAGLGVVAHHAWHRRSAASAMFVLAGLCSAGLGLRDWLVFRYGVDNHPVAWTPYAGAPFIVLVSWLLLDRFVRTTRSLEAVNRALEQRVAQREAELAAHFREAAELERLQAAGDERQRILRELHDGLGAKLLASLLRVEGGQLDAGGLARELRGCLADMRLASDTLVPGQADWAAAVGSFRFRWDTLLRSAGVEPHWQVELPDGGPRVAPYLALQLLRVMQEALTNVLRHADASHVRVRTAREGAGLLVEIEDDGRGIDAQAAPRGHGLADMRTRAASVGASVVHRTAAGGGTRVELRLASIPT
jgi:signal transduction histidine kinase